MAQYSKLVITNDGQALMAKMIAGSGNIEFTNMCSSSTQYQENQLQDLIAISNIEQTTPVSKVSRTNNVAIKVEAAFSNADITTGYYMRTLGLYAVDPDKGEILYAACIETTNNCYMPPYNGVTVSAAYIQAYTTVGNAESVSLEVNPGVYATIGDIEVLRDELNRALDAKGNFTKEEKEKLSGIADEANKTVVDSELSATSTNPVQNKAVKAAIDAKGAPVLIQETAPSDKSALWVW